MALKIPIKAFTSDGLDRRNLTLLKKRFLEINKGRFARTESALPERQRIFLKLLPLLFHANHPMMPGFVSRNTPSGVVGFTPTKAELKDMQRYAKSFSYNRANKSAQDILGIYIMGSCGTIAHSSDSDLDIWICYQAGLPGNLIEQLEKKCNLLTDWAASLGLEAHFFAMDPTKFKLGEQGTLGIDACGTAQHYLLLDEFYRTGLHIAGAIPLWWYIPSEAEHQYEEIAHELLSKRFVKSSEVVDFGAVANIPAGEFVGAGIWQLYKGIDSPYKSVLKLLLTEVYASEYPKVESLCLTFKKAVYDGENDIDQLDPYILVYKKLEAYLLNRRELTRLELVRRCLYFKINKPVSKAPASKQKSWQRLLLEKLVSEWNWQKPLIHNLDTRNQWKVSNVVSERKELVFELNHSYRFLSNFAKESGIAASISAQEMAILGRKLYAAFERRAGKIEFINPGISNNLEEDELFVTRGIDKNGDGSSYWQLVPDRPIESKSNPAKRLKRAKSLVELLTWGHVNGLIGPATRISVIDDKGTDSATGKTSHINEHELYNILNNLQQLLPTPLPQIEHENFHHQPTNTRIVLFINIGIDPLADIHSKGIHRISVKTDAFSYSGLKENLIHTIDKVTINSWGEVTTRHYQKDALIQCLTNYMNLHPPGPSSQLPELNVLCFSQSQSEAIVHRVEDLFRDIISCYYSGTRPQSSRYIFARKEDFHLIQYEDNKAVITRHENERELFGSLSEPQKEYSPIIIDPYALNGHILKSICKNNLRGAIQIYFETHESEAIIYVSDENSSLVRYKTAYRDQPTLLNPLKRFIQSMLYRQNTAMNENNISPVHRNVSFYEVIPANGNLPPQIERRKDLELAGNEIYFTVQAIADFNENGEIAFNVYCNHQEFDALDYGENVYFEAAKYILSQRTSTQHYPCYITDIDLSRLNTEQYRSGAIQTCLYLQYKSQIELAINTALATLSNAN